MKPRRRLDQILTPDADPQLAAPFALGFAAGEAQTQGYTALADVLMAEYGRKRPTDGDPDWPRQRDELHAWLQVHGQTLPEDLRNTAIEALYWTERAADSI